MCDDLNFDYKCMIVFQKIDKKQARDQALGSLALWTNLIFSNLKKLTKTHMNNKSPQ